MTRVRSEERVVAASAEEPPLVALACVAAWVAIAVHANALSGGFVLDDEYQVARNPWIRDWRHLPEIFSNDVWRFLPTAPPSNYYRPLMHVIYGVTYHLFGLRPWAFHLVNVGLHALDTVLVLLLARRLTMLAGMPPAASGDRPWDALVSVPFVAALCFATHPVHAEAVDWIASVPELTFTAFGLAALLVHTSARSRPLLVAALFLGALLAKETAITLVAVCVAFDVAFPAGSRSTRAWIARYGPLAVVTIVYLLIRQRALPAGLSPLPQRPAGAASPILEALPLFRSYLRTLVLPNRLHYWHSFHPLESLLSIAGIASVASAAGFGIALAFAWRKHRPSFVALALLVLPLTPAFLVGALPGKPFAERYLYFPSIGFVMLVAFAIHRLARARRTRSVAFVVFATMLGLYSIASVQRNRVWSDFYTLYVDSIAKSPDAPVPCDDLAHALFARGRAKEAIEHLDAQVKLDPKRADCQSSLGSALLLDGRVDEAITHLRLALSLDPSSLSSHNDLGIALRRKGDDAGAIEQYRLALRIAPGYAEAHFSLAAALADGGDPAGALVEYRAAVQASPENAYYRNVLGIECGKQGLLDEAIAQFREAVRLDAAEPAYRRNLERAQTMKAGTG